MSDKLHLRVISVEARKTDTKLKDKLKIARKGFLSAMMEARAAGSVAQRKKWLYLAKRFKSYINRCGKNK